MAKQEKLNHYVDLNDIRDSHKVALDIQPTAEELAALAIRCGILEIKKLDVQVKLTQGGRPDLFRVEGTLNAQVVQACGVTFAPVDEKINETFDEVLTTDPAALDAPDETDEDPNQPVELIENEKIDLGDLIGQWLAVSLDPYPRSDAPEFAHIEQKEDETGAKTHTPFSVLEKLKK